MRHMTIIATAIILTLPAHAAAKRDPVCAQFRQYDAATIQMAAANWGMVPEGVRARFGGPRQFLAKAAACRKVR